MACRVIITEGQRPFDRERRSTTMVDIRKTTVGEKGMEAVDLVVIAYDNRVMEGKDGKVIRNFLDVRMSPEDRRAPTQTNLGLFAKPDTKSPSGYNNSFGYAASQFDAIVEAAGDNTAPLLNAEGEKVGTIYGVNADLMSPASEDLRKHGLIIDTRTVKPSEKTVGEIDGKSVRDRIYESMAAVKARKAAEKTSEATVEAPTEEKAVEEKAVEEKPATAKKAPAKRAPRKPSAKALAAAEAAALAEEPEATNDEPELG